MDEGYQKLKKKYHRLFSELSERGWLDTWREVQENLLPDRGRFLSNGPSTRDVNDGNPKRQYILDSTPENAIAVAAAGLKSYLTTPSRPWIRHRAVNTQLNKVHSVRVWLDSLADEMHAILNRSNFYDALHNTYIEFLGFLTGGFMMFEDELSVIRCEALTIGEYAIATDYRGEPNAMIRRMYITLKNMVEMFGEESLTDTNKRLYETAPDARVWLYHIICPNDGTIGYSIGHPFISLYCQDGDDAKPLDVGWFDEFPFIVERWNAISNNVYGTEGPGFKELPNIKQLYKEVEKKLIAIDKLVEPPLVSTNHANLVNTLPGKVSYATDAFGGGQSLQPLYQIKPDIGSIGEDIEMLKESIKAGFFNQLFMMFSSDPGDRKTTYEIARLQEEKMSMLGPMIERLTRMLRKVVDRLFAIMERRGYFDPDGALPIPPEMSGEEFQVEFISLLAQAQKTSGLRSIDSFLLYISQAAQLDPSVIEAIDFDRVTSYYQDGTGMPADCLLDPQIIEQRRQARAQQQAMAQMMEAGATMAKGASQLGKTPMNQNTALDAVLRGGVSQ